MACSAGLRPDQPDLAVRPVRARPDLLRRAARLVHGLARRRPAHHAQLGAGRLGPHHPPRGLPARPWSSPASSSTSSTCGPSSSAGTPGTAPPTTCSTGPGTGPSARPPAWPCFAFLFTLFAASSTDVLANFFQISLNEVLWFFRFASSSCPIIAGFVAYQLCREMRACHGIGKRKRAVDRAPLAPRASTPTAPPSPGPATATTSCDPAPVPGAHRHRAVEQRRHPPARELAHGRAAGQPLSHTARPGHRPLTCGSPSNPSTPSPISHPGCRACSREAGLRGFWSGYFAASGRPARPCRCRPG